LNPYTGFFSKISPGWWSLLILRGLCYMTPKFPLAQSRREEVVEYGPLRVTDFILERLEDVTRTMD
uniref:PHTF2 factor n=1 Tax=Haemonchus placei TaxID=6290 RepID=A0A0N4WMQ8_HAEPC